MARLPCEPKRIGLGLELPAYPVNTVCAAPGCSEPAQDEHHIVRRSFIDGPHWFVKIDGKPVPNVTGLCRKHHRDIEEMRADIVFGVDRTFFYFEHGSGLPLEPQPGWGKPELTGPGNSGSSEPALSEGGVGNPAVTGSALTSGPPSEPVRPSDNAVAPGSACPTCKRRVPHPKKPATPRSAVVAFRVPVDELEAFRETWEAAADYIGVLEQAYWQHKVVTLGNGAILLDPKLKGFAK